MERKLIDVTKPVENDVNGETMEFVRKLKGSACYPLVYLKITQGHERIMTYNVYGEVQDGVPEYPGNIHNASEKIVRFFNIGCEYDPNKVIMHTSENAAKTGAHDSARHIAFRIEFPVDVE